MSSNPRRPGAPRSDATAQLSRRYPMSTTADSPSRTMASPDLRLTRRGRVVVVLLFLALLMGAVLALGGYSAATDARGSAPQHHTVVVEEGDTLWAIASEVA